MAGDGVPVVLATGRPPRWMRRIRDVLGYGTAVCCNGAVLMDLERFEIIRRGAAAPGCPRGGHRELRRHQPDIWFAVEYGLEFRHEPIYQPRWDVDAPGVSRRPRRDGRRAGPKLLARHGGAAADEFVALVEEVIGDRATVTHSSTDALAEISAAGVTKASGWPR